MRTVAGPPLPPPPAPLPPLPPQPQAPPCRAACLRPSLPCLRCSPYLPYARAASSFHWRAVRFFTDVRADIESHPFANFLLLDGYYQLVGKLPPGLGTTAKSASTVILSQDQEVLGGWPDTIAVITIDRNTVLSTPMMVGNPISISTGTLKWTLALRLKDYMAKFKTHGQVIAQNIPHPLVIATRSSRSTSFWFAFDLVDEVNAGGEVSLPVADKAMIPLVRSPTLSCAVFLTISAVATPVATPVTTPVGIPPAPRHSPPLRSQPAHMWVRMAQNGRFRGHLIKVLHFLVVVPGMNANEQVQPVYVNESAMQRSFSGTILGNDPNVNGKLGNTPPLFGILIAYHSRADSLVYYVWNSNKKCELRPASSVEISAMHNLDKNIESKAKAAQMQIEMLVEYKTSPSLPRDQATFFDLASITAPVKPKQPPIALKLSKADHDFTGPPNVPVPEVQLSDFDFTDKVFEMAQAEANAKVDNDDAVAGPNSVAAAKARGAEAKAKATAEAEAEAEAQAKAEAKAKAEADRRALAKAESDRVKTAAKAAKAEAVNAEAAKAEAAKAAEAAVKADAEAAAKVRAAQKAEATMNTAKANFEAKRKKDWDDDSSNASSPEKVSRNKPSPDGKPSPGTPLNTKIDRLTKVLGANIDATSNVQERKIASPHPHTSIQRSPRLASLQRSHTRPCPRCPPFFPPAELKKLQTQASDAGRKASEALIAAQEAKSHEQSAAKRHKAAAEMELAAKELADELAVKQAAVRAPFMPPRPTSSMGQGVPDGGMHGGMYAGVPGGMGGGVPGGGMGMPQAMAMPQAVAHPMPLGQPASSHISDILRFQAVQSMRDQAGKTNRTFEQWIEEHRRTQDYQMLMMGVYEDARHQR